MVNAIQSPRTTRLFRVYYAAVLAAAVALFVFHLPLTGPILVVPMVIVLLLMIFAEASPVSLPSGGYATASAVLDLPCLVILGPFYTAVLDVISTLVVQGILLRKPPVRVLFNLALFAITDFRRRRRLFRRRRAVRSALARPRPRSAPDLRAVYFFVNSVLVSIVIGLTSGPDPWRVWQRNFHRGILHHLSFIALGTLVAVTYFAAGPVSSCCSAIPFLVARHSFRRLHGDPFGPQGLRAGALRGAGRDRSLHPTSFGARLAVRRSGSPAG